ncbi:type II CRISPR-associated endonuclease Cas1, partial [bacterium]|nr:type II CRISPR-associated endonuclease Cas1 [bacterium]
MSIIEICGQNRYLSVSKGFLLISEKNEPLGKIPFDMIDAVIVTARGVTYSNSTLVKLCENGIPLILCDSKFMPVGTLLGTRLYHKLAERLTLQINTSVSLKKRLWKWIIQQKIKHQADVLKYFNNDIEDFKFLIKKVRSGDPDNIEAFAAQRYWSRLFGNQFRRNPDIEGKNSFLNYGYAIIRSALSRYVAGAGLNPSLGIFHHNKLNAFCLVDDLMEPFRPLVDKLVFELFENKENLTLTAEYKKQLVNILMQQVKMLTSCFLYSAVKVK